jgi:hypothetical protein
VDTVYVNSGARLELPRLESDPKELIIEARCDGCGEVHRLEYGPDAIEKTGPGRYVATLEPNLPGIWRWIARADDQVVISSYFYAKPSPVAA